MCNQTVLKELQLVLLDSCTYKTPVPSWGYVGHDVYGVNDKFCYKYFLMDSIDYRLQEFYFNIENMEEVYAKRRLDEIILYYANDEERLSFEFYIENKQKVLEQYISDADKIYFEIDIGKERVNRIQKHRLSTGLALNKLLEEFRANFNISKE
jgi:hypothetical protein